MFYLREIDKFGRQYNTELGKDYKYETELAYNNRILGDPVNMTCSLVVNKEGKVIHPQGDAFKIFCKEMFSDNVANTDLIIGVIYSEHGEAYPVVKDKGYRYYIMTENGNTFAKIYY